MNAFEVFNLPLSFRIDQETLEQKYLKLSKRHHPDTLATQSTREKLDATMAMANLNEAYETLKNPLKRGYHLLKLLDPKSTAGQEQTIKDPTLLMEAMEDQEALDALRSLDQTKAFIKQIKLKKENVFKSIQRIFDDHNLEEAPKALYRYRYYEKVLNDANQKLGAHASTT